MADWWTEHLDYDMRLAELDRTDQIFAANPNVRLVVMGHTHSPELIVSHCRSKMAPALDGWKDYEKGMYFWKDQRPASFRHQYGSPRD